MLDGPLRWLRSDGGFGATVTVASVQAERSVREKARWLRCDGDGGGGFGASREIGERESEVARGWLGMSWAREKARWLGVLGVARGPRGGSGWLAGWLGVARDSEKESREQRVRREREEMREMGRSELPRVFWKMVYGKFFRKPFSSFSFAILRSKTNIFGLTFILRRNKRLQMLKTF
jgi:hypothetical protein